MRLRPLMSLMMTSALALGLFCVGPSPVSGEEDLGSANKVTEYGPYRYKLFCYPTKTTAFFMIPHSYVTFDIVNGKYWTIESPRFEYEMSTNNTDFTGIIGFLPYGRGRALLPEKLSVTFYTPDMKVLGSYDETRCDHIYSVPRDGNDYERIICRIECNAEWNWDVKMRVYDAVDPVMAEPMAQPIYR